MLDALKQWFSRPATDDVPALLRRWAQAQGLPVRTVRQQGGCVVHGPAEAWRLEWGPPQRSYLPAPELRWIAERRMPADLVVLLLNRPLAEVMERSVYEQYVDDVQTRVDTDAPVEMRWLVMHERLGNHDLGPLRQHWAGVSSNRPWAQQWLKPELQALLQDALALAAPDTPVTLALGRGRVALRTRFAEPDAALLQAWHRVFDEALRQFTRLPV